MSLRHLAINKLGFVLITEKYDPYTTDLLDGGDVGGGEWDDLLGHIGVHSHLGLHLTAGSTLNHIRLTTSTHAVVLGELLLAMGAPRLQPPPKLSGVASTGLPGLVYVDLLDVERGLLVIAVDEQ